MTNFFVFWFHFSYVIIRKVKKLSLESTLLITFTIIKLVHIMEHERVANDTMYYYISNSRFSEPEKNYLYLLAK